MQLSIYSALFMDDVKSDKTYAILREPKFTDLEKIKKFLILNDIKIDRIVFELQATLGQYNILSIINNSLSDIEESYDNFIKIYCDEVTLACMEKHHGEVLSHGSYKISETINIPNTTTKLFVLC